MIFNMIVYLQITIGAVIRNIIIIIIICVNDGVYIEGEGESDP